MAANLRRRSFRRRKSRPEPGLGRTARRRTGSIPSTDKASLHREEGQSFILYFLVERLCILEQAQPLEFSLQRSRVHAQRIEKRLVANFYMSCDKRCW